MGFNNRQSRDETYGLCTVCIQCILFTLYAHVYSATGVKNGVIYSFMICNLLTEYDNNDKNDLMVNHKLIS